MRMPHAGIIAIVVAAVVSDVVLVHFARIEGSIIRTPDPRMTFEGLLIGTAIAQNGLLWTWAALGRIRFTIRFAVAGSGLIALTETVSWALHVDTERWMLLILFGAMAIVTSGVWLASRFAGLRLTAPGQAADNGKPRLQFSLANLIELTTAVACIAGAIKILFPPLPLPEPESRLRPPTYYFSLGIVFSLLAVVLPVAALRSRISASWTFLVAVAAGVVWLSLIAIAGDDSRHVDVILIDCGFSIAALIICRVCGYRIERRQAPVIHIRSRLGPNGAG
jgi:hypothetical protein